MLMVIVWTFAGHGAIHYYPVQIVPFLPSICRSTTILTWSEWVPQVEGQSYWGPIIHYWTGVEP